MRRNTIAIGIILVVAVAGMMFIALDRRNAGTSEARPSPPPQPITEPKGVVSTNVPQEKPLRWDTVESADYREYIANMRTIGVPEQTIHDIIKADVNGAFKARFERLKAKVRARKREFWRLGNAFSTQPPSIDSEILTELHALNQEKRRILKDLLGIDIGSDEDLRLDLAALNDPFDFLAPSKRGAVSELEQRFVATVDNFKKFPGWEREWERIFAQKDAELAALLSPQEKAEYDVRNSRVAGILRAELELFAPTEQEFRQILAKRKAFDDQVMQERINSRDFELLPSDYPERQQQLEDEIRAILGDARYAEYARSKDGIYRTSLEFVQQAGLPAQTADKLYELQYHIAHEYKRQILDRELAGGSREAALAELRQNAVDTLTQFLGEREAASYRQRTSGQWVDNILKGVVPAPLRKTKQN